MPSNYKLHATIAKGVYRFTTDNEIDYYVYFKMADVLFENVSVPFLAKYAVEFGFNPIGTKGSRKDSKIESTIINAINIYFDQNPNGVLVYLCDSEDQRQKSREKLFIKWFDKSNEGEYTREFIDFKDEDGQKQIISIIFSNNHNNRIDLIKEFYNQIPKSGILDKN